MLFLSLVAVPLLKKALDPAFAQREFVSQARRFRMLVWGALSLLLVTVANLFPHHLHFSAPFGEWSPALPGMRVPGLMTVRRPLEEVEILWLTEMVTFL